jgi:hypothetical protein
MPRTARASVGGYYYHVLNRGNARSRVFHQPDDYAAFIQIIGESSVRLPLELLAYCLMPNHFHLVYGPAPMVICRGGCNGCSQHTCVDTSNITAIAGMFGRVGSKRFQLKTTNIL